MYSKCNVLIGLTFLVTWVKNDSFSDTKRKKKGELSLTINVHRLRSKFFFFHSLYPYVNKYEKYPVGHPVIITNNFKDIHQYFGIAKVLVKPPKGLFHPVLPVISNKKLKFPLCRKCADGESQNECHCTGDQRSFVGTWCTPELELACKKGYEILKIYEVYHFEETSQYDRFTGQGGLFAGYVNLWAQYKQQSS